MLSSVIFGALGLFAVIVAVTSLRGRNARPPSGRQGGIIVLALVAVAALGLYVVLGR